MIRRKRTGEGIVYVARVGDMYKIGCVAIDLHPRLLTIGRATGQPVKEVLALEARSAIEVERFLHRAFKHKACDPDHVPGDALHSGSTEYFHLDADDIAAIPSMIQAAGWFVRPHHRPGESSALKLAV